MRFIVSNTVYKNKVYRSFKGAFAFLLTPLSLSERTFYMTHYKEMDETCLIVGADKIGGGGGGDFLRKIFNPCLGCV